MAKIVALDVLTGILKQVYNKTKKYTDGQITISLDSLSSLINKNREDITTNREDIATLKNTASELSENVTDLQGRLGTAESNITTLQSELAAVKSDVADLQSKVYDYLGNDEIDKVFEEA